MIDVEPLHHTGWRRYAVDAPSLGEAAYAAVRRTHSFLTDTNHTHEAKRRGTFSSVHIYRGEGAPPYSGPKWAETDYWFAVEYREPRAAGAKDGA